MAWLTEGAEDARVAERGPVAGPATDPEFDNGILAPLIAESSPELPDVLHELLLPTWNQMWHALDLLRTLPEGVRVGARWDGDRDAYTAFVQHVSEGGAPQPRRDGAVVMAEPRLTGSAFDGVVTLANPDRVDDSGKRPVLRPRIMVATTEPVRVEIGATLTSPARPSQKARVISLTPTATGTDVLLELSGGMGRKLVAEPGSVPAVGERLLLTTLSEAYRPGGAFPDPAAPPWTHGG